MDLNAESIIRKDIGIIDHMFTPVTAHITVDAK
jgi:hypothetical protein